ncbi:MAG: hypothetical protein DMG56_09500 [Acidobacteria bacterium]|nr:MAG: hypothetical protein DMG54_18045 [Acidobacteriota bacterium]PYU47490.1 MAG: hypothetical protein DMG53_08865 [Acidobacteriota bacterium]PYU59866.1 MAG: hypothetical protein DMG55_12630 [Acidobacteriota bacterium]PYU63571.1 MAG: hypothetical protein DMG56_09500 [Acidobacteriota bacterium]PYU76140.1 MAG: hypothetical protein DMG52_05445 [Acidobacteriota bacterium]
MGPARPASYPDLVGVMLEEFTGSRGPALPPVAQSLVCPILAGFRFSASAVDHLKINPDSQGQFSQSSLRTYAKRNKH